MEYERLLKILRTISDLNENNIIERVKEELEKEDPDTYKKWQDNGFNINYTFDDQSTLLHIAARNDLVKIAELLIKKGANVDAVNKVKRTPLHAAVLFCYTEVIKVLIENGVNVNVADQNGCTPLHCAAHNENKEIVELLLNKGANVDAVDLAESTVLHHAISAENCQVEIVKAIIQKEADVDIADKYGRTPLSWAIRNGYSEVAKILLENKADPLLGHKSFNTLKLLIELIKNDFKHSKKAEETQQQEDDEYELIKYSLLLRNDCSLTDVVERSAFGKLISTWLVDMSNLTESQKELNKKFLSTFKDFPHITYKDYKKDVEKIKKFLLDHKSNQDLKTILNLKRGESKLTILHILSSMECSNSEECIDLLLNSGADPNEKDDTGRTPLHYATRSGHCDTIIKLLLRKGANLDIKDKKGKTPIEFTVNNPNLNIKEYFLTDDVIDGIFRKKTQIDLNGKDECINLWSDFTLDDQNPLKYLDSLNEAQDINQLEQVVNEAIKSRVRFNLTCEGDIYKNNYESKYNFTVVSTSSNIPLSLIISRIVLITSWLLKPIA
ncbi:MULTISPECIES: ankyrin repeat domain-containing protein [unclassified Wolbachia]|uniref:ankyrin repeat domain-containing protein n=1 Tax=unclassified Wolbachia TaxID=2640676 RepID=UPI0003A45A1D|nr:MULTISPECIES: ankyrin repeat domain-containing protein [unclassified Wolbachia]QWE33115.1 Ankyrin repeat domain protein [Wolbachia endosymbiont of Drosophila simulans]